MSFRVTPQISISQAIQFAQLHSANLANLQRQASSGLRVHMPSDDPEAMRAILTQKLEERRFDAQLTNIAEARSSLNLGVSQLLEAGNLFVRAKELALTGNQSTDGQDRETLAGEVQSLINQLVAVANTQHGGRYLFGGTAVDTAPFAVAQSNPAGDTQRVIYAGAAEAAKVIVGRQETVDAFYSGDAVFQQRDRQETLVLGTTGAAAGSGTDSATGQGILTVRHTSTNYALGSGVQPGLSSDAGDTIIGPAGAHVLSINDTSGTGAFGTASLNGGPAVAFTSADADLLVTGPHGEAVYVDTTAINPGFSGNLNIKSNGSLSVDGGLSEVAIDFSANQVVQHSETGQVTHIDSTAIDKVGADHLEYAGTASAFAALIELRDELRNVRGLSQEEWHDAMARRITDLDRVREHVMQAVGRQSVSLENLDAMENRIRDLQLETRRTISELESADITEVAVKLQSEQNLLQFTYATTAALMDSSLLDFIR